MIGRHVPRLSAVWMGKYSRWATECAGEDPLTNNAAVSRATAAQEYGATTGRHTPETQITTLTATFPAESATFCGVVPQRPTEADRRR